MKIGFFTNTYLPNVFGLTHSIESFRKGLEALGHEVYVLAPKYYGYKDKNERVIRYPALFWRYKITYSIPFSYYPPINSVIDALELDVIHVHQPFSVAKDGLRQARRLGIPVVFTNHTRYEDYTHYVPLLPEALMKWHVQGSATNFANKCDLVISPSKEIKELIIARGVKAPISVLASGIDWQWLQNGNGKIIRKKYGIADDEVCLLWVGRMEKEKNVQFLIDVGLKVVRKNSQVKMLIVGDGSEKDGLVRRVKEKGYENRIIFTGLVPETDIAHCYGAGDIFFQPSLTETQGLSTTEALAAGNAVVAVRATGSVDLIEHEKNGLLVENDFKKCCFALQSLINDSSRRQFLGSNAREIAKKWDYREKSKELEMLYQKLIAPKKADT